MNEKQKNDFINGMKNIIDNIKPKTESDGTVVFKEWNKKIKLNKYKFFKWAYYSYDSTMNCSNWMKQKPLAGSPKYLKLLAR